MPSLIYEHSGTRQGGQINGRILIGRRVTHGLVITDPTVSRLHAWIDNKEGAFVLTDAGSRTGTFVNGEAIVRWELQEGDHIRIGPIQLTYHAVDQLPEDVLSIDLDAPAPKLDPVRQGILFDCKCGAPLWVKIQFAGRKGICKYCGEEVRVPVPQIEKPKKIRPEAPTLKVATCGICHSGIQHDEEMTTCIDCSVTYHTDCWMENYGCSTYGCAQVNSLKPQEVIAQEEAIATADAKHSEPAPERKLPWELILIAGSAAGSLVGALLFGVPALVIAILTIVMMKRQELQKKMALVALLIAVLGFVGGLALSDFWWFNGQHLHQFGA